ncbi:unnamed protein product, partial [Amoebophrya sp. A120]
IDVVAEIALKTCKDESVQDLGAIALLSRAGSYLMSGLVQEGQAGAQEQRHQSLLGGTSESEEMNHDKQSKSKSYQDPGEEGTTTAEFDYYIVPATDDAVVTTEGLETAVKAGSEAGEGLQQLGVLSGEQLGSELVLKPPRDPAEEEEKDWTNHLGRKLSCKKALREARKNTPIKDMSKVVTVPQKPPTGGGELQTAPFLT